MGVTGGSWCSNCCLKCNLVIDIGIGMCQKRSNYNHNQLLIIGNYHNTVYKGDFHACEQTQHPLLHQKYLKVSVVGSVMKAGLSRAICHINVGEMGDQSLYIKTKSAKWRTRGVTCTPQYKSRSKNYSILHGLD